MVMPSTFNFSSPITSFHFNMRRHFFMARVTEHRNRLPRKYVESPSLDSMTLWKLSKSTMMHPCVAYSMRCCFGRGLNSMICRSPNTFCDCAILWEPLLAYRRSLCSRLVHKASTLACLLVSQVKSLEFTCSES